MGALTPVLARLRAGLKRFTMTFSRSAWGSLALPRGLSRYDYTTAVGDGRGNSAVLAVMAWITRNFPEAPLQVMQREADDGLQAVADHALTQLLEMPNPFYSGVLLWQATMADRLATGNAYWLKVRSGAGRPVQLWWVPSALVEPQWPADGREYISHYEYRPNGQPVRVERADVVHFRYGLDPENPRKGLSPLAAVMREIFTDDEAAAYTATLLRNLGVPGVIISPKNGQEAGFTPADAEQVKVDFEQRFSNDNRGRPLVLDGAIDVQVLSFSPEQLHLRDVRQVPEERISAVFGVPAIVAGLGAGLARSTFANFREAREAAYEENIIPSQRQLAADLSTQLLPDFGDPARLHLRFDLSQVRVLQDDQNALMTRAAEGFQKGILTRGEARALVGQTAETNDDVFVLPVTAQVVPRAAAVAALAPPAPADAEPVAPEAADWTGTAERKAETGAVPITPAEIAAVRARWAEDALVGPFLTAQAPNGNGPH